MLALAQPVQVISIEDHKALLVMHSKDGQDSGETGACARLFPRCLVASHHDVWFAAAAIAKLLARSRKRLHLASDM